MFCLLSAGIEVSAVLVSDLAARLAASVLAPFDETGVPVRANQAVVELGAVHVAHGALRVGARVVLDKAEATRRLLVAIEAHDDALDVASSAEKLVYLLLGGVEGQIAHIERGALREQALLLGLGALELLVAVGAERDCRLSKECHFCSTFYISLSLTLSSERNTDSSNFYSLRSKVSKKKSVTRKERSGAKKMLSLVLKHATHKSTPLDTQI